MSDLMRDRLTEVLINSLLLWLLLLFMCRAAMLDFVVRAHQVPSTLNFKSYHWELLNSAPFFINLISQCDLYTASGCFWNHPRQ